MPRKEKENVSNFNFSLEVVPFRRGGAGGRVMFHTFSFVGNVGKEKDNIAINRFG